MRRRFSVSVLLLLLSCSRVPLGDRPAPPASDQPVVFSGSQLRTKGQDPLVSREALAAKDFSVSAWYCPEGTSFKQPGTPVAYFSDQRFGYMDPLWQGVSRSGATLSAQPVYWPLDGTLSFFCFAPYEGGAVIKGPVTDPAVAATLPGYLPGSPLLEVTPSTNVADQVDVLCAPPILDRSRLEDDGKLQLDFSTHRMTRVEFWFAYKGELQSDPSITQTFEQVRVTGIEIKDVVGSKYLYYTEDNCRWSGDLSKADYLLSGTDNSLRTGLSASLEDIEEGGSYFCVNDVPAGRLYLLPQSLPADATLMIHYAIVNLYAGTRLTETVSWKLTAGTVTEWPEGKVVRYLITLDLPNRGVASVQAEIIPWEDAGITSPEMELLY